MERLKLFEELTLPDSRQASFVSVDYGAPDFPFRERALEDIYQQAAAISLNNSVPEVIRSHFATALNLVAYSWFYYPFNATAQFMAYVSTELALKEFYGSKSSFKCLLSRAVSEGVVKESGFSHLTKEDRKGPAFGVEIDIPGKKDYAEVLVDALPFLRNKFAHGAFALHPHGYVAVRICADLINQLFPE